MYMNLKVKWASTLFALICVVMVPIPWIFERWGSELRRRSQFGYAALIRNEAEREGNQPEDEVDDQATLSRVATLTVFDDTRSMLSARRTRSRASGTETSCQGQAVIRAEPDASIYDEVEPAVSSSSNSDRVSNQV